MNYDGINARNVMPVPRAEPADASPGLRLEDVARVLRRRAVLLAACVLLAIAAAVYLISVTTPRYVASAEMLLGGDQSGDRGSRDLLDERTLNDSALQGEIAVLTSTALLARVADRLDLDQSPEFNVALRPPAEPVPVVDAAKDWLRSILRPPADPADEDVPDADAAPAEIPALRSAAEAGNRMLGDLGPIVGRLARSLRVAQQGTSYVVRVTASSEDPVTAAAIANALVDEYVAFTGDRRFAAAVRYTGWLETRVTELARAVEDSETAVLRQKALVESDVDNADRLAQQMQEMTSKLVDVRAALSETEARASEAAKLLAEEGTTAAAGVLESPVLADLDVRMSELRREREEARRGFADDSRQLAALDADLASLEAEMAAEVERVIEELQALARVQRINADALRASLAALERRSVERSLSDIEINQLERIADANRRLYEDFLDRFKQSSEIQNLRRSDAEVISFASPPGSPSTPRTKPTLVLAAASGLFVALGLAFLLELLPDRVATAEDVRRATQLHTFGELPRLPALRRAKALAALLRTDRDLARLSGVLRRNLTLTLGRDVRSALLVGDRSGGDKSMTAVLLAHTLADAGLNCLLVDADIRGAALSKRLADPEARGLMEALHGEVPLREAIHRVDELHLSFLPCRVSGLDPEALFGTAKAEELFGWMMRHYDAVVIDGPPLNEAADLVTLPSALDATLYVVAAGEAKRKDVTARGALFRKLRTEVEGAVLTRRPRRSLRRA
ncbi:exopolysaccharide transport family protein [Jannaschia sp. W003]|uniref:GumC family protein n=1 Tax=Jannaschia sp. W003 TaxID=2867012 RepID=UPI0021A4DC87|nr:exopolysaccharide transport family protein [Jannaschia sp. W003]UWQ21558.1 exopolysaccharide transport family protein [Jannaschia sp. W003]